MKNVFLFVAMCAVGLMAVCQTRDTACLSIIADTDIEEYVERCGEAFPVDSINGYATFSTGGRIVVVPEEITQRQYKRLLTDSYIVKPIEIDPNSTLYKELAKQGMPTAKWYYTQNDIRFEGQMLIYKECQEDGTFKEMELLLEMPDMNEYGFRRIIYYPEIRQYRMREDLLGRSFMMTEDGVADTTFMPEEGACTYGKNGIMVVQQFQGYNWHGSLCFYKYDESSHHLIPLCRYEDYRWSTDCYNDMSLCWISDCELLVSACSMGIIEKNPNWPPGGYHTSDLAPEGNPVYYKLRLVIQ
ncbi:MAG: hypothetical protein IJM33_01840 [Bacteroidales bacterium]|nr:hypothetical protein [Bacteroidales bacterium]MBR3412653.1 hypothetical protein [Bacteroidales bacterium]